MIIEVKIDENTVYHFSNEGKQLLQVETGVVYDEAYDIFPCPYTYQEVDREEELDPLEIAEQAIEVNDILLGEKDNEITNSSPSV